MANTTYRSVQAAKINTTLASTGYSPNPVNEQSGAMRSAYFSINQSVAVDTGDVLELCQVPAGARIIGILFNNTDFGTTVPVDIGDSDDVDRFAAASTALATAGTTEIALRLDNTDTDENPAFGFGYKYPAATVIQAKFGTVSGGATGVLRGRVIYVLN